MPLHFIPRNQCFHTNDYVCGGTVYHTSADRPTFALGDSVGSRLIVAGRLRAHVCLSFNDISHTLVFRSDDVSSSTKKDTLLTSGIQSSKGYDKATLLREEKL